MTASYALFVHDHRFVTLPDGQVGSPGKLPAEVWGTYRDVFENIRVIGRLTEWVPGREYSVSSAPGVEFVPVLSSGGRWSLRALSKARQVVGMLAGRSTIVIARLPSELGLIAATAARARGVPLAVEVVGCVRDAMMMHGPRGVLYAPFAYKRMQSAVRHADAALYVTESFLQSRYPTHGIVGVASNVRARRSPAPLPPRDRGDGEAPWRLGMIGDVAQRTKGVDVAVAGLAELQRRGIQCELRVVGEFTSQSMAQLNCGRCAPGSVVLEGTIGSGSQVAAWLDSLDVYIQPSRHEGLPRAVIEAMSRGLPVVASNVGGIPELIDARWLHSIGNWRQLANLVFELLSDPQARLEAGHSNWEKSARYDAALLRSVRHEFWGTVADRFRSRRIAE